MRSRLGFAAVVAFLFALPAFAHHSHGNYVDSFTDISGTVKEVHLLLPHSWIYLEVKDPKGGDATPGGLRVVIRTEWMRPSAAAAWDASRSSPAAIASSAGA